MADLYQRVLLLKRTPVFSSVATEDLRVIAQELVEEVYFAGEQIFLVDEPADRFYLIEEGLVGIHLNNQGGEKKYINQLGPGDCFGEMALFDELPRSASADAVVDAKLLSLDKEKLLVILRYYPALGLGIIRALSARVRRCTQQLAQFTSDKPD